MTTTQLDPTSVQTDRYLVISIDSHCGPYPAQLREYCERSHLEAFDEWAAGLRTEHEQTQELLHVPEDVAAEARAAQATETELPPRYTAGNSDMGERIKDMDADGVAAEVIFHGGQNGQLIPFADFTLVTDKSSLDVSPAELALRAVGYRIYNRWLAEWISDQPERHVGIAHIPFWDVDAAVAETEWARGAGLRSVNFPAPRDQLPPYNDRHWEPLWSACESLAMPLSSHGGYAQGNYTGTESIVLMLMEVPFFGRRALWYMIFGGVFERHPGLKLVITEQRWDDEVLTDMDSAYLAKAAHKDFPAAPSWDRLRRELPRLPSDYFRTNCFIGASMLSRREATAAIEHDLVGNVLWGSDYPHQEGCWPNTRLSQRMTFAGLPHDATRRMLGANAAEVYGFDFDALARVAGRIGPPVAEVDQPLDEAPEFVGWGFREIGKWA
jgi:predicted TIM-barrel fold metal-dependent hydrolase